LSDVLCLIIPDTVLAAPQHFFQNSPLNCKWIAHLFESRWPQQTAIQNL
jgi:hypothetical protein